MSQQTIESVLEQSSKTDVQVLLSAKEQAKRMALENPSAQNLASLEKATKMLESALAAQKNSKDWREALAYITQDLGRKLGKTKLFDDIKKGLLKKQGDGSFRIKDVERYAASLPMAATPDVLAEKASERQRRKEEEEIRRISAIADKEEFLLAVRKGQFIPREQVHLELAARAVTLSSGLKTTLEARGLDIIETVGGNPKKARDLFAFLEGVLDETLNEYSRPLEFDVVFEQTEGLDDADSGNTGA